MTKTPNNTGIIYTGTSNIVLPGNKQLFPPAFQDKTRLSYYASIFNTLEVNSTFYRMPQPKTLVKWSAAVPANFQFTVKLSKLITHAKDLQYNKADVIHFMQTVQFPPQHKGCLLVQLPGKITIAYFQQIESLLWLIATNNPAPAWRVCIEFRHPSWYNTDVYTLLDNWQAALVLHDIPASRHLTVDTQTDFIYRRFHGIAGDYKGSYAGPALAAIAQQARQWCLSGKDVYLYFNNTMGNAFGNALFVGKHAEIR